MTGADLIALIRALAVLPAVWLVLAGENTLALALFGAAALSDALDGWLARRSGVTGRGAFLDAAADQVLVCGTLVALAVAGRGWPVTLVAIGVTAREAVVAVLRWRALARGSDLHADRIAKVKTAAEMAGTALVIVGGRPWAVLGAGIVGLALLVGLATLPRYTRVS